MKPIAQLIQILLFVSTLFLFPSSILAETSIDYAMKSRRAYSAFECSAILIQYDKENLVNREKLFELGYSEGRAFIQAVIANKINPEDLRSTASLYFRLVLQGPNDDFILGRLWGVVANRVEDQIADEKFPLDKELKQMKARSLYMNKNCALLLTK
jgi:hypothetical protein